jgi:tetratricopeptide (TPR) repeat protein
MKISFMIPTMLIFGLASTAFGQQAKLEGYVFNDLGRRVSAVRVVAPGGQPKTTDSSGHFVIDFPSSMEPGQPTRITVAKPGWVVYEPVLGNCTTQSSGRNYEPLKVIIVPSRSPLALAPQRLNKVIAQWSVERAKLKRQVTGLRSQLDEYAFLREYAKKYGFTLYQFEAAARQWARSAVSNDKEEQALKEYFLENYDRAAQLAHESALDADEELERANQQRREAGLKVIRRFGLEGNALLEKNHFREALAAYGEIEKRFATGKVSKEDFASEWVGLKILLGNAKKGLGLRAEAEEAKSLLSQSIEDYRQALTLYSRQAQPEDWAGAQYSLGDALRAQGERLDGEESTQFLRQSVEAFRQALTVYTRERLPQEWAMTQNSLGVVLHARGERSDNEASLRLLGEAVDSFRQALTVYTRQADPEDWAGVQNNLGDTLRSEGERLEGEEAGRKLAQSVEALRQALTVYTREAQPENWAMAQSNLGIVLDLQGKRLEGEDGMRLLKQAAEAFRQALTVYTREQLPQDWAKTQNNLGGSLKAQALRLEGEEGRLLIGKALEAYRAALQVFTREQLTQLWAMTQANLAGALQTQWELSENKNDTRPLGEAFEAYLQALQIYKREQLPPQWAFIMNNAGDTLRTVSEWLPREEGMKMLEKAVEFYHAALQVHTREQLPQRWAMTQKGLAITYVHLQNWLAAAHAFSELVSAYPDSKDEYQFARALYHNAAFKYKEALALNQEWLARHPDDVLAQATLAENLCTTGQIVECGRRVNALVASREFPSSDKVALRAIEIVTLLALDQPGQVQAQMDALITEVSSQPPQFKCEWIFDGMRHFISQHQALSAHRDWLRQLFDALEGKDRDTILNSLRQAATNFKK